MPPKLTIQGILVALGAIGVVATCALAGLGLFTATLQLHAREEVAIVEKAIENHGVADALLDDVRSDVQRGVLIAVGLNHQVGSVLKEEMQVYVADARERLGQNVKLPLPAPVHQLYVDAIERLDDFAAGARVALDRSLHGDVGTDAFDAFRLAFADLDALMDEARDQLNERATQVRHAAAKVFDQVRWIIFGSLSIGVLLLVLVTCYAIKLAREIAGALAMSLRQAEHQALHDALTGLPNRVFIAGQLPDALADASRQDKLLALLYLDLDRFKHVNDTLGHPTGDELLRAVADRLRACVRKSDLIGRLGADEFVIVQTPIAKAEEAGHFSQHVIDLLSKPYEIAGQQIVIGVSVGIALAPADSTDPYMLLKMADMALHRAKAEGRSVFRSFEAEMDAKLQARRMLELDLRRAVLLGEFELHYQPLLNLASNLVTGCEALIRWCHPERGLVPPGEFIPLAEEIGLIETIGGWVLQRACRDATKWPDNVLVAVNVAAPQFKGQALVPTVMAALAASGLPPHRLELEITESALLANTDSVLSTLNDLRAQGVRIVMDDFGTGYSSLSYLLSFPFDKIKIDACFIRDLQDRPESRAIVRAVVGLAQDLGITTVAEGVETKEQLMGLIDKGCEQIQGYLLSRPVPLADLAKLLEFAPDTPRHVDEIVPVG